MKVHIRVVDIPTTATAAEAEQLLNAPYAEGYYADRLSQLGLPDGVGIRAFFRLRVKPERAPGGRSNG
jgi:hypothetical protein